MMVEVTGFEIGGRVSEMTELRMVIDHVLEDFWRQRRMTEVLIGSP